jgi:carboxymethylenebutenolidase
MFWEVTVAGSDLTVRSSEEATFDCYVAMPSVVKPTPAVVLACSIDGVDPDLRNIADAFSAKGYLAAAPDLFWRSVPGPLPPGDPRTRSRSQPRLERLAENERDLIDTLGYLGTLPEWNGRALIIGFCYGGPFAVIGPKRLGYQAGISCHGSQMLSFVGDVAGVTQPVCVIWGDQDHIAPPPVLDAFIEASQRQPNLEVHIFPGVEHGFMMPSAAEFNRDARDYAMQRTLDMLVDLSRS